MKVEFSNKAFFNTTQKARRASAALNPLLQFNQGCLQVSAGSHTHQTVIHVAARNPRFASNVRTQNEGVAHPQNNFTRTSTKSCLWISFFLVPSGVRLPSTLCLQNAVPLQPLVSNHRTFLFVQRKTSGEDTSSRMAAMCLPAMC